MILYIRLQLLIYSPPSHTRLLWLSFFSSSSLVVVATATRRRRPHLNQLPIKWFVHKLTPTLCKPCNRRLATLNKIPQILQQILLHIQQYADPAYPPAPYATGQQPPAKDPTGQQPTAPYIYATGQKSPAKDPTGQQPPAPYPSSGIVATQPHIKYAPPTYLPYHHPSETQSYHCTLTAYETQPQYC